MTWRFVIPMAVAFGLIGAAASLWAHEPAGADSTFRARESAVCRCVEVRP